MDVCLIAPIAYMVMDARTYKFGLIPAITMAAYTTYRVTMGIIQYLSSKKHENLLLKELRVINLPLLFYATLFLAVIVDPVQIELSAMLSNTLFL